MNPIKFLKQGKVRDIYEIVGGDMLIIHTTDRISAFDVVLPTQIPEKGKILTEISRFWFERTSGIIPNHLMPEQHILLERYAPTFSSQGMVVKKLTPLPVEAVVRGYISGSGWKDYQRTGKVCGVELPRGLRQSECLPEPIYTPSTKASIGEHDENITFETTIDILGSKDAAEYIRDVSLELYRYAAEFAYTRGLVIADTKFEFGTNDETGEIYLIDEMCTPDSSRYWPIETWSEGIDPPSLDKQFIRNYLTNIGWDKQSSPPALPQDVVDATVVIYQEIQSRLMGPITE